MFFERHESVEVRHQAEHVAVGVEAVPSTVGLPVKHRPTPGTMKVNRRVVLVDEPHEERDPIDLNRKISHGASQGSTGFDGKS